MFITFGKVSTFSEMYYILILHCLVWSETGVSFQCHSSIRCLTSVDSYACRTSPTHRIDDIPNRILRYRIPVSIGVSLVGCVGDIWNAYEPTEVTHLIEHCDIEN